MTNTKPLDHSQAQNLWDVWQKTALAYPDILAVYDPHAHNALKLTYRDLVEQMTRFGAGLRSLGIKSEDHVALIADNSARWLIADQGILAIGAINATRSSQAERRELLYILEHSDSTALVIENLATLNKLQPELQDLPIKQIILLSDENPPEGAYNFSEVIELGASKDLGNPEITPKHLATLIYTSGTGGNPKGVMLSHGNLLYQINGALDVFVVEPSKKVMSILPTWHSYERSFEYYIFSQGCTQIYTNLRSIKKDLKDFQANYMVAVPRLWESIYEGVQKQFREQPASKQKLINFFFKVSLAYIKARRIWQGLDLENLAPTLGEKLIAGLTMLALTPVHLLGDRLVYKKVREATGGCLELVVSGGGSIALHLEDFYEIVNIPILSGYGLTETSPITHTRRPHRNIRNGDGQPLPKTETKIIDQITRQSVPAYCQGIVTLRGPQIMQGYYKNPTATAKAIDPEGWFDSGDLGYVTPWDDLVITGRAKDTIVLSNGENIEPQAIEDACLRSPFIDQIIVVGQDQKQLGALIVPNLAALEAANLISPNSDLATVNLETVEIRSIFREELNREIKNRSGYSVNDRINVFSFIPEPFAIANGMMTQTFKIKRNVVNEHYQDIINKMFV
ncbi:AMP-forming long-chain acyl-CoA synthetase [Synechococcus sp. PCC 7502]|uniref:AMP-dependent synthetase/ligase n=1 Tax=Synechococcus sp. PCC 7502 TaxID=1173263 RepID=UPI00029F82CA|nr:AMP-binding protein [Synechococcus sp. PCC 7502]AFY74560.1 AMP-forming long-chain acyl-CoA synthetase [Synechococcus sp. PCC 7502]